MVLRRLPGLIGPVLHILLFVLTAQGIPQLGRSTAFGEIKTFRELERKWPNHVEADRILDNLNERFGIQYWW
jgi:hypothetical protein